MKCVPYHLAARIFLPATVFLLPLSILGQANDKGEPDSLDWEGLLRETEEILDWSDDPLADLVEESSSMAFWSASLRGGAGQTSNFLKRYESVSSRFLKIEGDLFYNVLFDHSALTALLYAEYVWYERQSEVDGETIAFANLNWIRFLDPWSVGIEASAFYGDQVYDASQTISSQPIGANLRQFRPNVGLFVEWTPDVRNLLKASLEIERAAFNQSDDNYWKPETAIEWTLAWSSKVSSTTEFAVFMEDYDEEKPRSRLGLPISGAEDLQLTGARIEEVIKWDSFILESLDLTLHAGLSREYDSDGEYKGLTRFSSSLKLGYKWKPFVFSVSGRWLHTRYTDRQTAYSDSRNQQHTYRNLKVELSRDFPLNSTLRFNVQWTDFNSRIESDSFSEQRVELLLGWTY